MSDAADDVGRLPHRQDLRTGRGVLGAHMRGWVGERRRRYGRYVLGVDERFPAAPSRHDNGVVDRH